MTFGEHVFLYCERGTNAALWAEPINAISNAGFFLAALIAWQLLLWRPPEERSPDHFLLVGLTFLIGFGSLAFHLYADQGTEFADIVPIGLFMMVYLGFALNRLLSVPPGWTVLIVAGFVALVGAAMQVQCWEGGIGLPGTDVAGAKLCLNGSIGYLPALGALIIVGMLLTEAHHRAAPYVVWAAVIFTISIILRSVDMSFCDQVVIDGREVGTHFIWHLLNAVVIFLLLLASLRAGPVLAAPAKPDEDAPKGPLAIFAKDAPKDTSKPPVAVPAEKASAETVPAKNETAEDEPKKKPPKTASADKEAAAKDKPPVEDAEAKPEPESKPEDEASGKSEEDEPEKTEPNMP